jgi:hypothetical protein
VTVVLKEHFEPEAYRRWPSSKQSQEAAILPATSLLLRFHTDEIVSHPSARVIPMPHVKCGRQWFCGEAEVIMSGQV